MLRLWIVGLVAALAAGCSTFPAAPPTAVAQLAPSGTLRAAINFGNPILATRAADGSAQGVSVDLARELGRRLGIPVELVPYQAAGRVVEGVKTLAWDLAFVAIDPLRGNEIDYSAAYVVIEGAYLVRQDSPIRANAEVDRAGVRIAAARGSAYDLFLSRELRQASIVHAATAPAVTATVLAQNLAVAAGVPAPLLGRAAIAAHALAAQGAGAAGDDGAPDPLVQGAEPVAANMVCAEVRQHPSQRGAHGAQRGEAGGKALSRASGLALAPSDWSGLARCR